MRHMIMMESFESKQQRLLEDHEIVSLKLIEIGLGGIKYNF